MKLNVKGCKAYCERKGIKSYKQLAKVLELSEEAIKLFEKGSKIDHDAVKDIYNKLGEKVVVQIINFEEETLNGFKSKYVQIGNQLY